MNKLTNERAAFDAWCFDGAEAYEAHLMSAADGKRAAFEVAARRERYILSKTPDGDYAFPAANGAWWAWQARP